MAKMPRFSATVRPEQRTLAQHLKLTSNSDQYLVGVDMSDSWDWKVNITQKAIVKSTSTGSLLSVPNSIRGAAFSAPREDPKIYIYGGSTFSLNQSFQNYTGPPSDTRPLWSYDPTQAKWEQHDISDASPMRPNRGAWVDVPDRGLGFFLNGYVDNSSTTMDSFLGNGTVTQQGMVMINTSDTSKSRNLSTSAIYGIEPSYGAAMTYIPGLGAAGGLVVMGGASKLTTDYSEGTMVRNTIALQRALQVDHD